jgi:hypothetical protein
MEDAMSEIPFFSLNDSNENLQSPPIPWHERFLKRSLLLAYLAPFLYFVYNKLRTYDIENGIIYN